MPRVPNGGDLVVSTIGECGVDTVFGIPASHTIEIYDALARGTGQIRNVVARNEQTAAYMADGYARRSGTAGIAIVTGGPGLGNAVTGLQTAYADSSPLVVIASDLNPAQRNSPQPLGIPHEAFDQRALTEATGATVGRADTAISIGPVVSQAIIRSQRGRPRPAVALVSRAALEESADGPPDLWVPSESNHRFDKDDVEAVGRLIRSADRPIVVVGTGVLRSGASDALDRFLAQGRLPYVTTVPGRSAVTASEHWRGPLDSQDSRAAVEQADLVLALGTSFGSATTANWTLEVPSQLVHVDIDPLTLGQHYEPAIGIEADVGEFLMALSDVLGWSLETNREDDWSHTRIGTVSHPWMDPLESALPARALTLCVDPTMALNWIHKALTLGPDRRLMMPWNNMTLGWAYGAAIGAQAAAPDDFVVAIMGDGGALFSLGELATAVEHDLRVCLLVFNNHSYGIIADLQDQVCDGRRFGVDLRQPDFVAVARAFDMRAFRAENPDALEKALHQSLETDGPTLIEAVVDVSDLAST